MQSGPRIAVALGGGSARGLTHIPYIEAMDEMGVRPHAIAGTSIGALIGAGWAAGLTGSELRAHAIQVLGGRRGLFARLWRAQIGGLAMLWREGISMQIDAERVVHEFVTPGFPSSFEELAIPLSVIAGDFQSWHQVVYDRGPLGPAIAGSIAIPSLFKPVRFGSHLLVDGGVVNPLPLDAAAAYEPDILIGIDVNGDPSTHWGDTMPSPLDIGMGSTQIMMHALIAHMIAAYPPDIYVRPRVQAFGAYEFWRVAEIIEIADKGKERFKRELDRRIEAFNGAPQRTP